VSDVATEHPPAHRLDAIAAGDADEASEAHVKTCAACAAYVDGLRAEAEAWRAKAEPKAFAAQVKARATRDSAKKRARVAWAIAPVLAAAAALVLWIGRAPSVDPIGHAPPEVASRFKGGPVVAVVRDRDGRQERLEGDFAVRAGDRVRVEVALDHDAPIVAGLLAGDGTWTALLAPTELEAGTHFSELAARFDDAPVDAWLLVGAPDDVARARATKDTSGVVAWRVRSEREP